MAYFLQVRDEFGNYRTLNIMKSDVFQSKLITKTYKRAGGYKLNELDQFTMLFSDEKDLKHHLISCGILSVNFEKCPIVIRFINKNNIKNYNLLYTDDLAYVYMPDDLIEIIEAKYREKNFKFLNDFARHFYWFRECSATASELLNLTKLAINNGIIDNGFYELDSNGDNIVRRLTKLLIYKYKQVPGGQVLYLDEFNWRTLHILIDFINSYDDSFVKEQVDSVVTQVTDAFKPKSMQKKKKEPNNANGQIPGQISIMDYLNY